MHCEKRLAVRYRAHLPRSTECGVSNSTIFFEVPIFHIETFHRRLHDRCVLVTAITIIII